MKIIVDRFENNYAICENEDKEMININISKIPSNCKEGDVLNLDFDKITIDELATKKRKKHIIEITKKIWKN